MNLSLILQNKAAEVVRNLVRFGNGKVPPENFHGDGRFSPAIDRRCTQEQTSFTPNAALAYRKNGQYPSATVSPDIHPLKRPLRVFQVIERNDANSRIDRLVISGSFNEVCAELDRLVAKESAVH